MRHKKKFRKLNKSTEERLAMLYSQTAALFEYEKIRLTLPRAKEVRKIAEKLITKAKKGDVANRRLMARILRRADLVKKVCEAAKERFEGRPGGYTRITKIGVRGGDAAPMALLELV